MRRGRAPEGTGQGVCGKQLPTSRKFWKVPVPAPFVSVLPAPPPTPAVHELLDEPLPPVPCPPVKVQLGHPAPMVNTAPAVALQVEAVMHQVLSAVPAGSCGQVTLL